MISKDIPNYVRLFDSIDFREGDEARSVYSPAAYLADLLQLYHDRINGSVQDESNTLDARRPDITHIDLDHENTYALLPYLNIVNEILENKIGPDAYNTLKNTTSPLNLPFNLDHERIALYLKNLDVQPEEFRNIFAREYDHLKLAQCYLDISDEESAVLVLESSVWTGYNNVNKAPVASFLEVTGLSHLELKELLLGNLSADEMAEAKQSQFFCNYGLQGYAVFDAQEENIVWVSEAGGDANAIPNAWFDRAQRLIRLSRMVDISFADVDLILRTCCKHKLNTLSLQRIAIIKRTSETIELSIDETCGLFSRVNTLGQGNEELPSDLFNRIFNSLIAKIDKTYIGDQSSTPFFQQGFSRLTFVGDILTLDNKPYRLRISQSLGVAESQLQLAIRGFRLRANEDIEDEDKYDSLWSGSSEETSMLTTLYRVCKLVNVTESSFSDMFTLLDILERDPAVRLFANHGLFMQPVTARPNCYDILQTGSTEELLWLTQWIFNLSSWLLENELSAEDLLKISTGLFPRNLKAELDSSTNKSTSLEVLAKREKVATLNAIYQQLRPSLLNEDSFLSDALDKRFSRIVYEVVTQKKGVLVAQADKRLVHFNEAVIASATYEIIDQLSQVTAKDFLGLGLEGKVADKIFSSLVLFGYLNSEGQLDEATIPDVPERFSIETDFTQYREMLFSIIKTLHEENVDVAVYASDFGALALSENQLNELYDNLIFNGYLSEDGTVLNPVTFEDSQNISLLEMNSGVGKYGLDLYNLIQLKIETFRQTEITISSGIFSELPLTEFEIEDLLENLKFNDYLDAHNKLLDNTAILHIGTSAGARELLLDLRFYPHRHTILNTLQAHIQSIKAQIVSFKKEQVAAVADRLVADWAFAVIADEFLQDGRIAEEKRAYFNDVSNAEKLDVDWPFDATDNRVVFERMKSILDNADQYRLTFLSFETLNFSEPEIYDLADLLIELGYLAPNYTLPAEQLPYFLNISNALTFNLQAFEDYNKDVFFILHALAKQVDKTIRELFAQLEVLEAAQSSSPYEILKENFGIEAESLKTIAEQVFVGSTNVRDEWLVPILASVSKFSDTLRDEPQDSRFNTGYRRVQQFALLAANQKLERDEIELAFHDQELAGKYPENIELPKIISADGSEQTISHFDALLESVDGHIYLFKSADPSKQNDYARVWVYLANTHLLIKRDNDRLTSFLIDDKEKSLAISRVDAAFVDKHGNDVLIADGKYYTKSLGQSDKGWQIHRREWGLVDSEVDDLQAVDAIFTDAAGRTYLFSNDQYARYSSDLSHIDNGYPKNIADSWASEGNNQSLPVAFQASIDAAFHGTNNKTYLFKDQEFVCSDSASTSRNTQDAWGKIRNNLTSSQKIDACYADDARSFVLSGDQIFAYRDSLENPDLSIEEGYPKTLKEHFGAALPGEFYAGVDVAFKGEDGLLHLFKGERSISFSGDVKGTVEDINNHWGLIENDLAKGHAINAALTGLDGRIYLFCGTQYFRYSSSDYSEVDTGYPRGVTEDWGGLTTINAAFVHKGKTYLFGTGKVKQKDGSTANKKAYVRYSTNDYKEPDDGYPKAQDETDDFWWNLPQSIKDSEAFTEVDAVFNAPDGKTFLFAKNVFIYFDHVRRWWSEPQQLSDKWSAIPFSRVDAIFSGKDGKTYCFSGGEYVRFSGDDYCELDNGYPRPINKLWGNVKNNIIDHNRVDAALVVESREEKETEEGLTETLKTMHTYLFSGDQFFRYRGNNYSKVETGYPKSIRYLNEEPRFQNLKVNVDTGIDAAFGDRRNVYLFKESTLHIVSEAQFATYEDDKLANLDCVVIERGAQYVEKNGVWYHLNNPETKTLALSSEEPPVLTDLPAAFHHGINAILLGADSNAYVFKGNQFYNVNLNQTVPIAEKWGRVRNNIQDNNSIDAALLGRDGKTYLFSGDQYVVYSGDDYIGQRVYAESKQELAVKPITQQWAGLTSVHLAYVTQDQTYLFEKPDADGNFRYLRYSSSDYLRPDAGFPKQANADFWQIPEEYRAQGWNYFDAILVERDGGLIFVKGREFLQFNSVSEDWFHPKSIDTLWAGEAYNDHLFDNLQTVFTGRNGATYFIAQDRYLVHRDGTFSTAISFNNQWGMLPNLLQEKIDAAFVYNGTTTYLFSGNAYVRYSGRDYCTIDKGYPKAITSDLRQEIGFQNLPQAFEVYAAELDNGNGSDIVNGIVSNAGNTYVYMGGRCYISSYNLEEGISQIFCRKYDISILGHQQNRFAETGKVDAAFVTEDGKTYLFSGDQYIRYSRSGRSNSNSNYAFVDNGYPKRIATGLAVELGVNIPPELYRGIDAAMRDQNDDIYLFKDKMVFSAAGATYATIKDTLGKVKNNFRDHTAEDKLLDGAFVDTQGRLYVFKGDQIIRYQDTEQAYVETGYPRSIASTFKCPKSFQSGVHSAFSFAGHTYLVKGDNYVRFSSDHYQHLPDFYPVKFTERWGNWSDYRIKDIQLIARYKQLQNSYSGELTLTDILKVGGGTVSKPYSALADIFDWDVEEVKWLKRHNAFLPSNSAEDSRFNIELLCRMFDILSVTGKMASAVNIAYENIWQKMYIHPTRLAEAADSLYGLLANKNGTGSNWLVLETEIHNKLNAMKRDALVSYVIANNESMQSAQDLYEQLLIDVSMGSCGSTSTVKEAISAVQLYFHRYFVNLEAFNDDDSVKNELEHWWKWMRNYRVWEANRKVFLYPENYIRPELRDTKTPEFKKLEDTILQGEINQQTAETSFREYLNSFADIGNLKIAGANMHEDGSNKVLILIGHTRVDAPQYYYRTAKYSDSGEVNSASWTPWGKIDATINSSRVFPVIYNGRLMVFWIEIEEFEESRGKITQAEGDQYAEVGDSKKNLAYRAHVKYSFNNYSDQWSPPQTLQGNIKLEYKIDAAFVDGEETVLFCGNYCMKTSKNNLDGDVKTIREVYPDLPPTFYSGIDAATIFNGKKYFFKGREYVVQPLKDKPSSSIESLFEAPKDNKAILIRRGPFGGGVIINDLPDFAVPAEGFGAAFVIDDGVLCLVDKDGTYTFYTENTAGKLRPITEETRALSGNFLFRSYVMVFANKEGHFSPVDAAFKRDDQYVILREGQYEIYSLVNDNLVPLDGYPKPIKSNLNFNMNKLFDKLHVVLYEGHLNITYATPYNEVLLSGKLASDFSFDASGSSNDNAQVNFKIWDSLIRVGSPIVPNTDGDSEISARLRKKNDDIVALKSTATHVGNIKIATEKLDAASKMAKAFKSATKAGDKAKFQAAIDGVKSALKPQPPIMNAEVKLLLELASALEKSANEYVSSRGDRKEKKKALMEASKRAIRKAGAILEGALVENPSQIKRAVTELKAEIKAVQNNGKGTAYDLQESIDLHKDTASIFSRYFASFEKLNIFTDSNPGGDIGLGGTNELFEQYKNARADVDKTLNATLSYLNKAKADKREPHTVRDDLDDASKKMVGAIKAILKLNIFKGDIEQKLREVFNENTAALNRKRELIFGRTDIFPNNFNIANTSNFTFSEPDWYCFEALGGTFLCRPLTSDKNGKYEIVRLTTTVIPKLSGLLFAEGIDGLLNLETQKLDERPGFGTGAKKIPYASQRFTSVPKFENLDFEGANSDYYWEIFFHAPFHMAASLNTNQKFEEAKQWYEYIFDPTSVENPWKFLPFQNPSTENHAGAIEKYLNDPFDPHAIASMRQSAYKKAIVMAYVDNLLDWGDMLFRQYSHESINEARMLYILAYDLLGSKPQNLGDRVVSETKSYVELVAETKASPGRPGSASLKTLIIGDDDYDFLVYPKNTPNSSVVSPYFYVPGNTQLIDLWSRVEDRLYKIRHCLNIKGISQPLPLFQPPIDPMALVRAASSGAGLSAALASLNTPVPHYRFNFMLRKAQELVEKLTQFGGELLSALEKKDAEDLSLLQNRQEGIILALSRSIKDAQLNEAEHSLASFKESKRSATKQIEHYTLLKDEGLTSTESVQIGLMSAGSAMMAISGIGKIATAIAFATGKVHIGPFTSGYTTGGETAGKALEAVLEGLETGGDAISMMGEVAGIYAQHERTTQDWDLQLKMATSDVLQIEHQIEGAKQQIVVAKQEIAILEKEIEHQASIKSFMQNKFTNAQLYQWTAAKLSSLYYQTYQMAYDIAKEAEKAFCFERGVPETEVNYINGMAWDSQKKGLLAGDSLGLSLDRMDKAYIDTDARRFEITKTISLLALDPLAFLTLKSRGKCDFHFTEELFDYDFPGHYCRQVKTIAFTLNAGEGKTVNATLTQLRNKTVMSADAKAVKYLINPKGDQPLSIRSDWRSNQQIALSKMDPYLESSNGLFELNFGDERYLPYEGTGAVSSWRLELSGKRGSYNIEALQNVVIELKYTALQGGELFANVVKGMLKPYETAVHFDIAQMFPDEFSAFISNQKDELEINVTRDMFPNISGSKISGVYSHFEVKDKSQITLVMNGDSELKLRSNKLLLTNALAVSSRGSTWRFKAKGEKVNIVNLELVFVYKATVE